MSQVLQNTAPYSTFLSKTPGELKKPANTTSEQFTHKSDLNSALDVQMQRI